MAISTATVFEVRTTGSDGNSGGFVAGASGTDLSQSDSASYSFSDLASSNGTNASPQVTSASHNFVAADVGNLMQITSGTNWTTGFFQIVSVAANAATLDRACGSSATLSSGSFAVGGALASPGMAGSGHVAGNTIYVKAGTYTVTSASTNISNGCLSVTAATAAANWTHLIGYNTSRGDGGTKPIIKADGVITTFILIACPSGATVENIEADGNSRTSSKGFSGDNFYKCRARNCTNSGYNLSTGGQRAILCEATTCSTQVAFNGAGTYVGCTAYSNTVTGFGASQCIACISANNTGASTDGFAPGSSRATLLNCTSYGNGRDGFRLTAVSNFGNAITNCVAVSNTGTGFNTSAAFDGGYLYNCAGFGNAANVSASITAANNVGFITLTATPFTNAAGNDFSLNNTAGGGAAVRAAGLITSLPGLSTTNYADVGAAQHQDSATGGLTTYIYAN